MKVRADPRNDDDAWGVIALPSSLPPFLLFWWLIDPSMGGCFIALDRNYSGMSGFCRIQPDNTNAGRELKCFMQFLSRVAIVFWFRCWSLVCFVTILRLPWMHVLFAPWRERRPWLGRSLMRGGVLFSRIDGTSTPKNFLSLTCCLSRPHSFSQSKV